MNFFKKANQVIGVLAAVALVAMLGISTVNVIGRQFFNFAVVATVEVVELSCVVLVALGLAYTQAKRSNVIISIVVDRLPQRTRAFFDSFALVVSLAAVIILGWTGTIYGWDMVLKNEHTDLLLLPKGVFRLLWVAGCAFLFVAVLAHVIEVARKAAKR